MIKYIKILSNQTVLIKTDKYEFKIRPESFLESKLKRGDKLSQKIKGFLIRENIRWTIKNYGLSILAKRSYSQYEYKQKVREKAKKWLQDNKLDIDLSLLDKYIEENVEFLIRQKILDDQVYSQNFCQNRPKKSKRQLEYELKQKGVEQDIISKTLGNRNDEEKNAIKNFLVKKSTYKDLSNFKEKNKIISALLRKGFAYDTVKSVIDDWQKLK